MATKIVLDDIRKIIVKECKADCDFVSGGCIVRKDSFYEYETPYPPSHHIDKELK